MSTNNDVFKVLVAATAEDGADKNLATLAAAEGALAILNADTNLSMGASSKAKAIKLALPTVADEKVEFSAGQYIPLKGIRDYTMRAYSAPRPLIVKVGGYVANCETEYGIRLSFNNEEIFKRQGYNQFTHPYTYVTGACDDCGTICPTGDANEVTLGLAKNINNDPLGLAVATMVARQAITKATVDAATGGSFSGNLAEGDAILEADVELLIAYNKTLSDGASYLYTDLVIETVPVAINKFCSVNLRYYFPRQTNVEVSGIAGFEGVITPEVLQELAFEEGNGYDLQQKEYNSQAIGGSPYVLNTVTGTARYLEYQADAKEKYDVVAITYDALSYAGWDENLNHFTTWIAFPIDDENGNGSAELQKFLAVMDALLTPLGFDALADDAALNNADETVVEPTSERDDVNTDGLA